MRKDAIPLNECVETSLKVFDTCSRKLHLEYTNSIDISVEATTQKLYDVGSSDRFDDTDEITEDSLSFNRRRRGEIGTDKFYWQYLLLIPLRSLIWKIELSRI